MKKMATFLAALGTGLSLAGSALAADTLVWDKTFPQSSKVSHQQVTFYNRLGINLVGDLYLPRALDLSKKNRAIIVGHPFGSVKEQCSGLYAQIMAERGFVALTFDASYGGESGGEPRSIASPEAYVEDFSAAVDFIGTRKFVDREKIGVIGICGSGGFSLAAAAVDPRMKAIVTVSMYDMGRDRRDGYGEKPMTIAERQKALEEVVAQRYVEFEGGPKKYVIGTPEVIDKNSSDIARAFYDYYRTPRGHHPRSTTAATLTSNQAFMNFYPFANIEMISPRPILFIAGEKAHSLYFSQDAYKKAREPKELYIVPGAIHVDLYDRVKMIPFDKIQGFFDKYLK